VNGASFVNAVPVGAAAVNRASVNRTAAAQAVKHRLAEPAAGFVTLGVALGFVGSSFVALGFAAACAVGGFPPLRYLAGASRGLPLRYLAGASYHPLRYLPSAGGQIPEEGQVATVGHAGIVLFAEGGVY